jgi:hypothetical protein
MESIFFTPCVVFLCFGGTGDGVGCCLSCMKPSLQKYVCYYY